MESTFDRTKEILESKSLHRSRLTEEELAAVTQEHAVHMKQRVRKRTEDILTQRLLPWRRFWEDLESTQDGAELARLLRDERQRSIQPVSLPSAHSMPRAEEMSTGGGCPGFWTYRPPYDLGDARLVWPEGSSQPSVYGFGDEVAGTISVAVCLGGFGTSTWPAETVIGNTFTSASVGSVGTVVYQMLGTPDLWLTAFLGVSIDSPNSAHFGPCPQE